MSEKEIESQILTWLNFQPNTFAIKLNTVGIYDEKRKCFRRNQNKFVHRGASDILCCVNGSFLAIEVKTPQAHRSILNQALKEKPYTEHVQRQIEFLSRVNLARGRGILVSSLKEVEEYLKTNYVF